MDVVGGISSAIKLVVKAKELADKLKNLEMKGLVVDLQSQLLDLKEQIIALREENHRLSEEMKKKDPPPELTVKNGAYFNAEGDGPFCTGCYDADRTLMRLAENAPVFQLHHGLWRCPKCRMSFGSKFKQ